MQKQNLPHKLQRRIKTFYAEVRSLGSACSLGCPASALAFPLAQGAATAQAAVPAALPAAACHAALPRRAPVRICQTVAKQEGVLPRSCRNMQGRSPRTPCNRSRRCGSARTRRRRRRCFSRSCRTRCATRWPGRPARRCSGEAWAGAERGLNTGKRRCCGRGTWGRSAEEPHATDCPNSNTNKRPGPCCPAGCRQVPLLREMDEKTLYLLASKMTPFRCRANAVACKRSPVRLRAPPAGAAARRPCTAWRPFTRAQACPPLCLPPGRVLLQVQWRLRPGDRGRPGRPLLDAD